MKIRYFRYPRTASAIPETSHSACASPFGCLQGRIWCWHGNL